MVFEKIRDIAAEQLSKDASEITLETDMQKDLDADSLDVFQIISDIEDEFDVKIENVEGLSTVGDVVTLVEGLIKEK